MLGLLTGATGCATDTSTEESDPVGVVHLNQESELPGCWSHLRGTVYYIESTQELTYCDGSAYQPLQLSADGLVVLTEEANSEQCANRGVVILAGRDLDGDGLVGADETEFEAPICNGEDGTNCTITAVHTDSYTLGCEDGTSITVSDGAMGVPGETGPTGEVGDGCTISDPGTGDGYMVSCGGGAPVFIRHGRGGADTTSCSEGPDADGDGVTDSCDLCPSFDDNNLSTIDGNVTISNMGDFAQLIGVREVTGSLTINGLVTSLTPLECLRTIRGGLSIQDQAGLTTLEGLHRLEAIWGDFGLFRNERLVDFAGLDRLETIGGDLRVASNDRLTSLFGLESVRILGGGLYVGSNPSLVSLAGMGNVTAIGEGLSAGFNPSLVSFSGLENITLIGDSLFVDHLASDELKGLENLTTIEGDLNIGYNVGLSSLRGLEALTSIGGTLTLSHDTPLTSLSGLDNLTTVNGIWVSESSTLRDFSGLESLTTIERDLILEYSPGLTSLDGLEGVVSIGGRLDIFNNDSLTNLAGLRNVAELGQLRISENDSLTSLTGREDDVENSSLSLEVAHNPLLSQCAIDSWAETLTEPYGDFTTGNLPCTEF